MADPVQNRLRELFDFDADAGVLIWRSRPVEDFATVQGWRNFKAKFAGTVAGSINGSGYRVIGIDGKMWMGHRLIWVYANGEIPAGIQVDHINGNRDDNRLENLRLVTHSENQHNSSMPRNNTSGVMGVYWKKSDRKWQAQIRIDGRCKYLGQFDNIDDAAAARAKAEREFGFHPGHGKSLAALRSPAVEGK